MRGKATAVDGISALSIHGKRVVSPSYFPKIHTKEDLREAKAVQDGYSGIGRFEGIIVDLYRASLISKTHSFDGEDVRSFDEETVPDYYVFVVDPRVDLLFLPALSQTIAKNLVNVFDKLLLFDTSPSLASARRLLQEERERVSAIRDKIRLHKGRSGPADVYAKTKDKAKAMVERLELALINKAQSIVSSDKFIETIVKAQMSWGSDIVIPPYFPIDLSQPDLDSSLSATIRSYNATKALAGSDKLVAFPICFDIVSPSRRKEEAVKGIERGASAIADLLADAGNPILSMVRVADMRETSPQLILYLKMVRELKKKRVGFVHGLDPGCSTILGIYYLNHGLNSFSCLPSRPPATGGRGGTLKVEGRYLWLDTLEIMNEKRLKKQISIQGEIPCGCGICRSYLQVVRNSKGEQELEGTNDIFYDRKVATPGSRVETRNRRSHHFLFNLLNLQSQSRTSPPDFDARIKNYSENCEKHIAVFEISKELWQ